MPYQRYRKGQYSGSDRRRTGRYMYNALCPIVSAEKNYCHRYSQDRLDMVKAAKIADHVINPTRTDVGAKIEKLTKYGGADAVIEMAGGEDTFDMAWRIARPNAVVCIGAMYEENQILPLTQMYGKNLTFKTGGVDASRCGEIMKLIESGKIDGTCLITHRFNLEDAMTAYDIFENKKDGVIKVVLKIPQGH